VGPKSSDKCPYKKFTEERDTHRSEEACGKMEAETSEVATGNSWSHQQLIEAGRVLTGNSSECSLLRPHFQASDFQDGKKNTFNTFLSLSASKFVVICYFSHRKLTQRGNLGWTSAPYSQVSGCLVLFFPELGSLGWRREG
jgi:hypothetical protein